MYAMVKMFIILKIIYNLCLSFLEGDEIQLINVNEVEHINLIYFINVNWRTKSPNININSFKHCFKLKNANRLHEACSSEKYQR